MALINTVFHTAGAPRRRDPRHTKQKKRKRMKKMKKWFENASIERKLKTGFLIVALFGILTGVIGINNLIYMTKNQKKSYNDYTMGIRYSSQASTDFMAMGKATTSMLINYNDAEARQGYVKKIESYITSIDKSLDAYSKTISDSEEQQKFEKLQSSYDSYLKLIKANLAVANSDTGDETIKSNMANAASIASDAETAFRTLTEDSVLAAQQNLASNESSSRATFIIMIALILIAFLLVHVFRRFISQIIADPLQKFSAAAELLAVGDVDMSKVLTDEDRLLSQREDEIGTLAGSFEKIIAGTEKLSRETVAIAGGNLTTSVSIRSENDLLGKSMDTLVHDFGALASAIISAAEQVDAGAQQVASASTELAQGTSEQASNIEELSASVAEISERVKQNAEDAERAKDLSEKSGEIMGASIADMEKTQSAMNEIETTSRDIGKVIRDIDDIAFQTNILALNAAVEAARAGTAGKGFAVVADEVRNLAQKSAEAAQNTTSLIENAIGAVKKGSELVNRTSQSFSELSDKSREVNALVEQISDQAQQQATAIAQVSAGIEQISAVVQMNSATSEESASASEGLSSQADYLKESVGKFKI